MSLTYRLGSFTSNRPRRRQVIIREQLRFPSGFSTAVLIGILHGKGQAATSGMDTANAGRFGSLAAEHHSLLESEERERSTELAPDAPSEIADVRKDTWAANIKLLLISFAISGLYTFTTYFIPVLRNLPLFGTAAASTWLWTLYIILS